ncbi:MAG: NAD(P)-dependent oxidoreductase, partial [Firmicutes bacterium]|nr:NAD(P)-dependent oxidoreductase [Bacillota bacterium]
MPSIKHEAARCLKCKKPMCAANCPVSTQIPEIMNLFLEGEIAEAGRILFENNPLSAITSVICPHERNCLGHCVLGNKGGPVEFFRVEEYISRYY